MGSEPGIGRMVRTLAFWALLIVGTIALVQFASDRRQNRLEISYNQLVTELDRHNVAKLQINGRRVDGEVKAPITAGTRTGTQFRVILPFEPNDAWAASLVKQGLEIHGSEERQSFAVVLLTFLPYVLIMFLVLFMLRQVKARRDQDKSP